MPRPGPKPYECVRRAWHSERHQPIRGSIIQEIFRIANDVHHPDTQKNKEWQEKLPLVVLKAEEVIYSKANSEAEYMDLKTLWDRTNDAIDTIIRRDDAPETEGDFLLPCIEAALNLGCIPRRASRSQRHNNPCCYLGSASGGESVLKLPDINMLVSNHLGSLQCPPPLLYRGNAASLSSRLEPRPSVLGTTAAAAAAAAATADVRRLDPNAKPLVPETAFGPKHPFSIFGHALDLPSRDSPAGGTYTWPRFGCVYPLYNIDEHQPGHSTPPSLLKPPPQPNLITGQVPCLPSICQTGIDFLHNFVCVDNARGASNASSNCGEGSENPPGIVCDLSLRLGLSPHPSLDAESCWNHEVEDVGSSSSYDGSKFSCPSPGRARAINFESSFSSSKDKAYDFFPLGTTDDPLESFLS